MTISQHKILVFFFFGFFCGLIFYFCSKYLLSVLPLSACCCKQNLFHITEIGFPFIIDLFIILLCPLYFVTCWQFCSSEACTAFLVMLVPIRFFLYKYFIFQGCDQWIFMRNGIWCCMPYSLYP